MPVCPSFPTPGRWDVGPEPQRLRLGAHHEDPLLLGCLETAMAELGGGVNELEFNILQGPAAVVHQEGLRVVGEDSLKVEVPTIPSLHFQSTRKVHPPSSCHSLSLSPSPLPTLLTAGWRDRAGQLPKPHIPWGLSSLAHRWELTFLNVMTRFLVPAMHPFSITKSLLTSP